MPQLNPNKLRFTPKKKYTSSGSSDENNFSYEVISTLESIGVHFRTSIDPGSYVPAHLHHAIEIIYLLEGNLTVTIESSIRDITQVNASLSTQMSFIPRNVAHQTEQSFSRFRFPFCPVTCRMQNSWFLIWIIQMTMRFGALS